RPDPKDIAQALAAESSHEPPRLKGSDPELGPEPRGAEPPRAGSDPEPAPLSEIVRRPGVAVAMLAALASFAVMVSVMNLTGYVVVDHHHHSQDAVFPIVGAHVLGMYALVLVIGSLIDRIGRTPSLAGGLLIMAASSLSLLWVTGVAVTAIALFGLGIGWNVSFVAATATLADCAAPWERGKLLGFNDLLAGLTGATLALVGGVALTAIGVAALALGGAVLVIVPAVWILRTPLPGGDLAADEAAL
ncbi:MAG TPA: MFS transporter, partial [Solirubrobacteraceae bacterium]|nr:MFS transporter [Solirubrobacteraceae bacterium]